MVRTLARLIFAIVFVCLSVNKASAVNPDTGPGCGLGKVLWANFKNQKNIMPQVFMGTTNATGFQSFAISSGTSGCTHDGVMMSMHEAHVFVANNAERLSQDMARGEGEYLASLATLMGVQPEHRAEFFALTQQQYQTLSQAGDVSATELLTSLYEEMAAHPGLAHASRSR